MRLPPRTRDELGVAQTAITVFSIGIWAIIVGEVGVRLFECLAYQAMRPWFARWRLDLAAIRGMISFGLYTTGSRFLYRFHSESDYLVLGKVWCGCSRSSASSARCCRSCRRS